MRRWLACSLLLGTVTAYAAPPRDGANHRLGDDSFVAHLGRAPTDADSEALRMHVHLAYVREQLAAAPPTRPALAARRAEILGYLDEYIAKAITPANTTIPLRTPVFVDDIGNLCAVGYLIERTTGSRALPARIAAAHRFDFLEDIAATMPEVRAWVDGSGFTLAELASIQPGYAAPDVEAYARWTRGQWRDGTIERLVPMTGIVTKGQVKGDRMTGTWTNTIHGKVIGTGGLTRGSGAWTSYYQSGAVLAKGRFVANDPSGAWTFFHESGNVAAEGRFTRGYRDGAWRFYADTPAKTPIAKGAFHRGSIAGAWQHYDVHGALLAVSRTTKPGDMGGEYLLEVVRGADGIRHELHVFGGPDEQRLAAASLGRERIYRHARYGDTVRFDANGFRLEKQDGTWRAADCQWSDKRRRIARAGDTSTLHRLLVAKVPDSFDEVPCGPATLPVAASRVRTLDAIADAETAVRSPTPTFVKELALGRYTGAYLDSIQPRPAADDGDPYVPSFGAFVKAAAERAAQEAEVADLPRVLAASLAWYIEFPHIDGRFVRVFHTLPGYARTDAEDLEDIDPARSEVAAE